MSDLCIGLAALLYLGASVGYLLRSQSWFALAFLCYAIANCALVMAARK